MRKVCAIRRCADLAPFGRTLCDRHERKVSPGFRWITESTEHDLIAARENCDFEAAVNALKLLLIAEHSIRLSIEADEAREPTQGGRP